MQLVGWFSHIICDTFWDLIFGSGEVARMVSIVLREDITRNLMFFSGFAQVTSTLGKGFGFCDTCMIDSWWTLHSVLLSIRGRLSDI